MRIYAQQVLDADLQRRVIFTRQMGEIVAERHTKFSYILKETGDYVKDIMVSLDLPSSIEVQPMRVRGFDRSDDFLAGNGYVEVHVWFATLSDRKIRADMYVPFYRGELLYPSVMRIDGKLMSVSQYNFDILCAQASTHKPKRHNVYNDRPHTVRVDNIEVGLFSVPHVLDEYPVYDRYIPDEVDTQQYLNN